MNAPSNLPPEWVFYYPSPVWSKNNWLKSLIPFFDGIVLLAPEFARAPVPGGRPPLAAAAAGRTMGRGTRCTIAAPA